MSRIINGGAKPRPSTVTKLIHALCHSHDEYQNVIACYEGGAEKLQEIPGFLEWKPNPEDERARAKRYLQIKSESIKFADAVERELIRLGLNYERNVFAGDLVADFVIRVARSKVAVECKYNVSRDWDRTFPTVKLLQEGLPCDEVVIAIPYENELVRKARDEIKSVGGQIVSLENLKEVLA